MKSETDNKKGEYRIDEMLHQIYEAETMNLQDGSDLLNEGLSGDERERILNMTLNKMGMEREIELENGQKAKYGWKKRRILIGVLVAVFAFATTAFAAEIFQWDSRISKHLGIEEENNPELLQGGMNVGVSAEDKGVTIQAVQTIGDGNNMYILLDVMAPEGKIIYPDSGFDMIYLQVDGASSLGYGCEMLSDEDENDNKATMLLSMEANKKINDKMLKVSFHNLRHYMQGSGEFIIDYEGDWELEWKLDYKDISKKYTVEKELRINENTVDVDTVSISPIALNVTLSGNYIKEYDSAPPEPGTGELIQLTAITLKDGTVLTQEDATSWGTSTRGSEYVINMQMKRLLDVEQISSITLNDTEFKL